MEFYLIMHLYAWSRTEKNYLRFSKQNLTAKSCVTFRGIRSFFYSLIRVPSPVHIAHIHLVPPLVYCLWLLENKLHKLTTPHYGAWLQWCQSNCSYIAIQAFYCCLFNDVLSSLDKIILNNKTRRWTECGKKRSWRNLRYCPGIRWKKLRSRTKSSVARISLMLYVPCIVLQCVGTQYGPKVSGLAYKSRAKWKMLWGIYSAIYGEVNVSVEKCVEIEGDYVEK